MTNLAVGICFLLMSTVNHASARTNIPIIHVEGPNESQDDDKAQRVNDDIPEPSRYSGQLDLDSDKTTIRDDKFMGETPGHFINIRRRRSAKLIAFAILRGLRATNSLLSGTKQVTSTNKYYTEFQKSGNYAKAQADFNSVRPINIKETSLPSGSKSKWGMVGDRMVIFRSSGENGKPTVEIVQGIGTSETFIDKITYVN